MSDPNKWALLIGINKYVEYSAGSGELRGCVNDAKLMASILQDRFRFNSTLLLDAAATRDGILAAVDHLAAQVQENDVAVVFYSGRSVYRANTTGRWPDGRVSILAPYDYAIEPEWDRYITYDELGQQLAPLIHKTPNVILIIDSSYAGTIRPFLDSDPALDGRLLFLGACRTLENVYDVRIDEVWQGAFTYALGQALVSAGPGATYLQVFKQVSSQVSARFPDQHPQMEGEGGRLLFGVDKGEEMRFVRVFDRSRSTVKLGAGAVHGMTAGSTWAIYPPDTLQVTNDTPKRGLVEITSVGAVESEANILSEVGAEAITAGAKAIEETHHYGEMRLIVDIQVPDGNLFPLGERLRQLLEESDLLRVAQTQEHANITVWLVEPRNTVRERDPVPQLGALDVMTWALIDESDRLIGSTRPVEDSSAVWDLRDNLERLARTRNVLNLRNPDMNSPLVGKVDFVMERQLDDGAWVEPDARSEMVVLEEGDRIRFAIINRYHAPLYVSILDFPWGGSVSLIFPNYGGGEKVGPGERVETPALEFFIPYEPAQRTGRDNEPSTAQVENIKMFATAYPTEFGALVQQESVRGIQSSMGEATMLWELLDMALTGYGSRRSRLLKPPAEQDWITVERSFAVRRRQGGREPWLK